VSETHGANTLMQAVYLEDLKTAWAGLDPAARAFVVFFSDCPHLDVTEVMLATKAPILVVADALADVVNHAVAARGMEFAPAVRFGAQVTCALDPLFCTVQAMRITPDRYKRSLGGLVAEVINFFGFECRQEQFEAILTRLGAEGDAVADTFSAPFERYVARSVPAARSTADFLAALPEEQRRALLDLTDDYAPILRGESLSVMDWPPSLFLDWERPGVFLQRTIELTGPARFIICGPYLHLPAGDWNVEVHIETRECYSENTLAVDVFSGDILAAVSMRLKDDGAYAFDMNFQTVDPLLPAELRFQLLRGAIEGQLTLLAVRVMRNAS